MYDDYKIKPLQRMLPKTDAYVKSYDGQTKWLDFWLKMMTYWKNIILFGIKSDIRLFADIKKEFDSEPVYKNKFWKQK